MKEIVTWIYELLAGISVTYAPTDGRQPVFFFSCQSLLCVCVCVCVCVSSKKFS